MDGSVISGGLLLLTLLAAVGASGQMEQTEPVVTARAVIATSLGSFTSDLYGKDAPRTVENFIGLAEQG